jgi:hypothetical protein
MVVPIILRPCDWEDSLLGKLTALPEKGKPVVKWDNPDSALLEVVKGLKKMLPFH